MQLENSFTVPVSAEEAWTVLQDVERIAPCMPGATIESVDGDEFHGRVKVKVGPITVTYRGSARFVDLDAASRTATMEAKGKETRGSGTAQATVSARLTERDGATDVVMTTDLAITGKPAQFGRGVMADVGAKLVSQFADCLAEELASDKAAVAEPSVTDAGPAAAPIGTIAPVEQITPIEPSGTRQSAEAIDLFDVAGAPVAKRLAPAVAALALLAVVVWFIRRGE